MAESPLSVSIISSQEEFHALEEPWNRLLEASPSNTFFLRWEWLWSWWEAFGASLGTLHILLVKREDQVVGIGPFYWTTTQAGLFSVRRLLFLGTAAGGKGDVGSEYLDLIVLPVYQEEVLAAISVQLLQEDRFQEWMFLHVPDQAPSLSTLLAQAGKARYWLQELHRWKCPYISLPARWDQFLESLGSTLRYKFRKNLRELEKHGAYCFRLTRSVDELDRDLPTLVLLHQARWEGRGMSGVFADPAYERFLSMVSRYALQHGLLRLSIVTVSDKPVAAVYNIVYGNKVYYYQSGFDTAFDRKVAIGTFAHTLCIKQAIGEELGEYDFLLKGSLDTYKDRWTKAVREIVDYRLIAPGGGQWMAKAEVAVRGCVKQFRKVCQ